MSASVQFRAHHVTDGAKKVRVWYWHSRDPKTGAERITVAAKDYGYGLGTMLPGVQNATDIMTDYFDKDWVDITPDSPFWPGVQEALRKVSAYRDGVSKRREKRVGGAR